MESDFYDFMKFPTELLYHRYDFYLPFFDEYNSVLDLGCGDGVFLELLAENEKSGLGVDSDSGMVEKCKEKELEVILADVFRFLEKTEKVFDGIFCAHLIEHFERARVEELVESCHNHLRPGGVLVLVTPNPACLQTHLHEFWRDPSHIRLYDKSLLAFLLNKAGFEEISVGENTHNQVERYFSLPKVEDGRLNLLNPTRTEEEHTNGEKEYAVKISNINGYKERGKWFLSPLKYVKSRLARFIESRLELFSEQISEQLNRVDKNIKGEIQDLREDLKEIGDHIRFLQKTQVEEIKALQHLSPYPEIYAVGKKSKNKPSKGKEDF